MSELVARRNRWWNVRLPARERADERPVDVPRRAFWTDVFFPFALSRMMLFLVAWFTQYFTRATIAPKKGYFTVPERFLDVFSRWDSEWYLTIIQKGYYLRGDLDRYYSNVAFFPLYPVMVRTLTLLFPDQMANRGFILLVGVILSNVLLLGAVYLLYRLALHLTHDVATARRAVLYLLIFPTAFYFSAFYTESTFLFFSLATFWAAVKRKWLIAGLLSYLLALSRPVGVLVVIPLAILYLESIEWKFKHIKPVVGWFALAPAGLLTFLLASYVRTGNFLAPMQVQAAWGRTFATPWKTLFDPRHYDKYVTELDWAFTVVFLLLAVAAFFYLRKSPAYAVYALLLFLPALTSNTLRSSTRFAAVVFPAFIVLAILGKNRLVNQAIMALFLVLHTLLFVAWTQFYWIA